MTEKCETCDGAGWVVGVEVVTKCCQGSDWECGARGCSGPVMAQEQVQEMCADCHGTGEVPPQPQVDGGK